MKSIYIIIILFVTTVSSAYSQDAHKHLHKRNEIGISSGGIYGFNDKTWGAGVHMHYFRSLGDHSRWAIGGFYEYAWLDGNHYSFGVGAKFEAIDRLHLGLFPGLVFLKHEEDAHDHSHSHGESEKQFAVHAEVVYDLFEIGKFHFGPVADYSWSKDDSHVMLGIHAAYSF